jgi:DNA polymerase-3 subunit gamma/tau
LPQIVEPVDVKPLTDEQLRAAWSDYAQLKKNQVAEFHLLNRTVDVQGTTVTVALANSIEEPLLQTILPDLLTYLRSRLSNSSIKVETVLRKEDVKKIAYTNKEKFDLLAEKNPMLRELKERLGLDPDF